VGGGAAVDAVGRAGELGLIVAASPLSDANRETVQKCREQAKKAAKSVRCTIEVKGEE
jgi:1,4-dihydroxy-2-naphthoyl-CoA synthase